MIRYTLRCDHAHRFESWFGSSADFDRLHEAGLVACSICGSASIVKDMMAPSIGLAAEPTLSGPASPAEQALAELRRRIEATSEDVGRNFAREARAIHDGLAAERPIIGEANSAEARALIEDGIPVARLPWSANPKSN
jgi:hypothetical protein